MMKAVVLEIKENYAAVLMNDGTVRKIRNNGYVPGQEIDLAGMQHAYAGKKLLKTAAVAAAVLAISGSSLFYASETVMAYSTVTVTVDDTEVELTLNRRNEVIEARALDEAGDAVAEKLQITRLHRKSLDEAVTELSEPADTAVLKEVVSRDESREEVLAEEIRQILPERRMEQIPAPAAEPGTAEQTNRGEQGWKQSPAEQDGQNTGTVPETQDIRHPSEDQKADIQQDGMQRQDTAVPQQEQGPMRQDESGDWMQLEGAAETGRPEQAEDQLQGELPGAGNWQGDPANVPEEPGKDGSPCPAGAEQQNIQSMPQTPAVSGNQNEAGNPAPFQQ